MATRRSSLGAGIQQAAATIAGAVNKADDVNRAQAQLAIENQRADITQDQQQQLINIQLAAENRLSRNADFDQANTVLGQLGEVTGAQAMTLFADSAVSEALAAAFTPEELEGFVLNERNAEDLRLDYLSEDIRIGNLPGATDAERSQGEIARNIYRGRGVATDAQLALASTDATTRLEIQVQQGADLLRRAQEDPGMLNDDGFLKEPYVSEMFGITTQDPEQALELIKLEQANLAVTRASGSSQMDRIGDLRDIYIRQADDRGIALDPIEVERIISAVTSGEVPAGHANMGAFLRARIAEKPEAAEFYQQIVAGGYTPRALGADNPEEAFRQIQEDFPGEENENLREFLTQQVARLAAPSSRVLIESDGGFFGARGFEERITAGLPINFDDPAQMDAFVIQAAEDIRQGRRTIEEVAAVNADAGATLAGMATTGQLNQVVPSDIPTFLRRFQSGGEQERVPVATLMNLGMTRTESHRARNLMDEIRQAESGGGRPGTGTGRSLEQLEDELQTLLTEVNSRGR